VGPFKHLYAAGVADPGWPPLTNNTVQPCQLRPSAVETDSGYWLGQLRWPKGGPVEATCLHTDGRHLTPAEAARCARQHRNALLRGESDWRPGPEDKPIPAPFPVGACLEYIGLGSLTLANGEWVQPGTVGVVVEVEPPGESATAEDDWPEDGYSVIRFYGSPDAEVLILPRYAKVDWHTRYRLADCPSD
jgi:hypothetical protein